MPSSTEGSTIEGSATLRLVEPLVDTVPADVLEGVPVPERYEACYREADRLWRAGIEAEENGRVDECGALYDEAHRWYISAVWHDSSQNPRTDYIFYLKLAHTEVGVAQYGNHDNHPEYEEGRQDHFFMLAEKSYKKAERCIPQGLEPTEVGIIQSIIYSQRADMHIVRGIVDTRRQSEMLREAKHDLEEAEGCIPRDHERTQDTGVSGRIQVQKSTIEVIEGGRVKVRRLHPQLGALLVGVEASEALAA